MSSSLPLRVDADLRIWIATGELRVQCEENHMRVDIANWRSLPELWRRRRSLLGAESLARQLGISGIVRLHGIRLHGWSAAEPR